MGSEIEEFTDYLETTLKTVFTDPNYDPEQVSPEIKSGISSRLFKNGQINDELYKFVCSFDFSNLTTYILEHVSEYSKSTCDQSEDLNNKVVDYKALYLEQLK
jgi:hypothetical protein